MGNNRGFMINTEKLIIARIKKGLSRKALADRIGCSSAYIGQIERGKTSPSYERTQALCDCLGVSVVYLNSKIEMTSIADKLNLISENRLKIIETILDSWI